MKAILIIKLEMLIESLRKSKKKEPATPNTIDLNGSWLSTSVVLAFKFEVAGIIMLVENMLLN